MCWRLKVAGLVITDPSSIGNNKEPFAGPMSLSMSGSPGSLPGSQPYPCLAGSNVVGLFLDNILRKTFALHCTEICCLWCNSKRQLFQHVGWFVVLVITGSVHYWVLGLCVMVAEQPRREKPRREKNSSSA